MAADRATRFRRRLAVVLPILLVVVLGIGAAAQAVRPVPEPTHRRSDDVDAHSRRDARFALARVG